MHARHNWHHITASKLMDPQDSMCMHAREAALAPWCCLRSNGPTGGQTNLHARRTWYHITAGHTNDVATGDTCAFLLLLLLLLPVAVVLRVLLTLLPDHGVVSHSWAECAGLGEGWSRLLPSASG
eukprot:1137170-Pelagomonas_calceolata.AAC.6